MRWFLTFCLFFSLTTCQSVKAENKVNDKVAHFAVSYAASVSIQHATQYKYWWMGPVVSLALGVAKEFADSRFDWADMAADSAGVGASIMVVNIDF